MTIRAAVYARVSSAAQDADDKVSISEQQADIESYCADRGYSITGRYSEVGRGWDASRPEFARMLADASAGRFDVIVAWKSDRLSRGIGPAAAIDDALAESPTPVQLEAVKDTIDRQTFGLMAAISRMEIDNLRERSSMGKRGKAKSGRSPVQNVPYGFTLDAQGRPETVTGKAAVVRRIFALAVEDGLGGRAIAARLTAAAIPAPGGGARWWPGRVSAILGESAYAGTWHYGRKRHTSTKTGPVIRPVDRVDWIEIPFPAIIDVQTYDAAQAGKKSRKRDAKRNTRHHYALQRLVTCTSCGRPFTALARVKAGGRELDTPRRFYQCSGDVHHKTKCRPVSQLRADTVEAHVWAEVRDVLTDPDSFVGMLGDTEDGGALDTQVTAAERDLARVQSEDDKLVRLYLTDSIDEAMMTRQRRFITERLEAARLLVDRLRDQRDNAKDRAVMVDNVGLWAAKISDGLDALDEAGRTAVMRDVLDAVHIDGNDVVTLQFAIPADEPAVSVVDGRSPLAGP